jgi:hypothetical protein
VRDGTGQKILAFLQRRWQKNSKKAAALQRWPLPVWLDSTLLIVAAKQMFTEELFHDPNVRRFFRDLLLGNKSLSSRAGYSVKPTERGLKKIDDTHPYYV